ncbi:rho GTPase-activating protein 21 isoform X3 [Simochromis diagramma]|uniref:rho GTPase-activating protein 21 isoform X3 n=1 Tax=Simochromis diagramma TaxID=43689 RepID=UPI001A7EFC32|nr:rho GTPase-activating protein 21 isoform X3 [Simochromis diagramma]
MAQAKEKRDGILSSNENRCRPLSSSEVEGVLWHGPRTIFLQKNSQGFGFTLRHFIVYPPKSFLNNLKDEENGNGNGKGCQRSWLEPMDTIFVKSVKENGPAQQAGLCTGDRLVKVNGQSILGKTYSQVIALIQNSENILELSIMPKDEDVLQLVSAYSKDAYMKGNEPYSGKARNLPEPPPPYYPSNKPSSTSSQTSRNIYSSLDNWQCRTSPVTPPLDNRRPAASTPPECWFRSPEDPSVRFAPLGGHRGRSSSAVTALDFHFVNHNAAIASATLPPPRKAPAHVHVGTLYHQQLSDYSHIHGTECISPQYRSISQDHLAELGLGLTVTPKPSATAVASLEQRRKETFLHHQAAAAAHYSCWFSSCGSSSGPAKKSCSETLLAAYAEYEHNYGRSMETLAQASALVSPHSEQTSQSSNMIKFNIQKDLRTSEPQHQSTGKSSITTSSTGPPSERQSGQQVAEPQKRRGREEEQVGYKSYSPTFSHKAGHVFQQAHSFREPGYSSPHLDWRPATRDSPADTDVGSKFITPQSASEEEIMELGEHREVISPVSVTQEVVLRQTLPPGRHTPIQTLQHSNYNTPVESTELPGLTLCTSPVPAETIPNRRSSGNLAQNVFDSLSSIPFIGSIKNRRSSYLLAITTERSRSCDEGLNTFREESPVFSKLPKRVKSFFTDGSLESLQAQEDARSKRHSTSELGIITFSDVHKEGWLHYKQILTEKGKKVGGSMRPWRRAFSVLRSHSLFLYKDKRDAVIHGAGAGPGQVEHCPISIRCCLIDIAYSETKRKHTLRLTTQDFCEYLLQAEDNDDMLAWIKVIRENSKTDNEEIGFSRQALINKKLNDYKKHSLTGSKLDSSPRAHRMMPPFFLAKTDNTSVNRASRSGGSKHDSDDNKALWSINIMKKAKKTGVPKAFGVRLEDCQPAVNHKFVPLIVEMCCGVVEATGLEYTGIYRVPGNNAMVSNLQEHLNKGMDLNTAEERWQDLNVISSLLKTFFRKLPEPLFTDDKYNHFIDANRIEDGEERLKTMNKLIHDLPDHYYHTLKFLLGHLKKVADHSEKNKMEPRNLALVFGPTLVRTSEDNMTDMVTHMPDRYKIVETLILHYDWFFSNEELDKEEKAPDDNWDIQPLPNIDHLLTNIGKPGMPREASGSTTSDSLKLKLSSASKKDPNTKSVIAAVTHKHKKSPSIHTVSRNTDEISAHEPAKASKYGEEGGVGEKEERGELDEVEGEQTILNTEKRIEGKISLVGGEQAKAKRAGSDAKMSKRRNSQRTNLPPSQLYPNRGSDSTRQIHTACSKSPPLRNPPSHFNHSLARGYQTIPFWVLPTRSRNISSQSGTAQHQSAPICYRKTRGGRTRAVSMNLDLELGRNEDVRGCRDDRVKVVRMTEGEPGPRSLPHCAQKVPSLISSSSGWIDQSSSGHSTVILRRSGLDLQDKLRAWRRHTVVV